MPPLKEFGRRQPPPAETTAPVKRSSHVALLLMGTLAVGGGAYALMPSERCEPELAGVANFTGAPACPPRSSSSSGGGHGSWGSSSRSSFYGGDSPSGSSGGSATEASSGHVVRGGFGSFAHAFAAHFSGGG